ncbi:MAG TPA: hypothetical protein VJY54_06840 [Lachnospiraceae bacterium]|nr:hypothetical protein [Lachnospiraceae bacterium]
MRRMLIGIFCLLMMCSLIACSDITKTEDSIDHIQSDTKEVNTISVTTEAPKDTTINSDGQTFSTKSENGSIFINITTTKDNHHDIIKEIFVVNNSVTLNTISNIIGYYDNVILDTSSIAIVNYYGRLWSNFLLLDVTTGDVLYYEPFNFTDIKTVYQYNNMMDFDLSDNDVMRFSCDKILDKDSIIISYQVHDMDGYLQSGNFKYIISKNEFEDLQENEPITEG